jgi:hypothetical protein
MILSKYTVSSARFTAAATRLCIALLLTAVMARAQDAPPAETFTLTRAHVALLRAAVVVWDPSESGAPVIAGYGSDTALMLAENPDETSLLSNAAQIMYGPAGLAATTPAAVRQTLAEMGTALEIALHSGLLAAGEYAYTERLPRVKQANFKLAARHLALLRHANAGLTVWQVPGISSKRPYGDMTFFYLDMADALGMPYNNGAADAAALFTPDQVRQLDQMHAAMLPALQVFLLHAAFEPGTYQRRNEGGMWTKAAVEGA